jgi:hypothetical protein
MRLRLEDYLVDFLEEHLKVSKCHKCERYIRGQDCRYKTCPTRNILAEIISKRVRAERRMQIEQNANRTGQG